MSASNQRKRTRRKRERELASEAADVKRESSRIVTVDEAAKARDRGSRGAA